MERGAGGGARTGEEDEDNGNDNANIVERTDFVTYSNEEIEIEHPFGWRVKDRLREAGYIKFSSREEARGGGVSSGDEEEEVEESESEGAEAIFSIFDGKYVSLDRLINEEENNPDLINLERTTFKGRRAIRAISKNRNRKIMHFYIDRGNDMTWRLEYVAPESYNTLPLEHMINSFKIG